MAILAIEEFSRVDASAGVVIDVQNTLVNNALRAGAAKPRSKISSRAWSTIPLGAYALSEANSGSDAFSLAAAPAQDGDDFILNGRKLWITNAKEAGLFIVFATVNPELGYKGITAFLIERDSPGFSVGKKEDKLGIRASSTCELILEDCRVPKANVMGEVGKGYKMAIETLNEGRIGIGAQMLGLARGALEHAIATRKSASSSASPSPSFKRIQFQLARLATEVEAARLMVYNAARLKDAGQPFLKEAAMAKLLLPRRWPSGWPRNASRFMAATASPRIIRPRSIFRDSKIGKIYEGTSFMQLQTIAKLILG